MKGESFSLSPLYFSGSGILRCPPWGAVAALVAALLAAARVVVKAFYITFASSRWARRSSIAPYWSSYFSLSAAKAAVVSGCSSRSLKHAADIMMSFRTTSWGMFTSFAILAMLTISSPSGCGILGRGILGICIWVSWALRGA